MRRSVRWTLFASVITALALFVAACGGSNNKQQQQRRRQAPPAATPTIRQGKQGGTLTYLAAGDVDYLDPGQTTTRSATWSPYADNRPLYSFKPDDSASRCRTSPTATRRSRRTTRRSPSTSRRASSTRRRSTARSSPPDIKYAFERAFSKQRPERLRRRVLQLDRRPPAKAKGEHQADLGHHRRRTTTRSSSSSSGEAPLSSQALVMPITVPVPKEYAAKFDAKTPSTYDQYVAFTGPYMVKNDRDRQARRAASPGKSIEHRPQPELGQVDRLPSRLPGRDQHRGGQRRPDHRLAAAR